MNLRGSAALVLVVGLMASPVRAADGSELETSVPVPPPNNRGTGFFVSGEGHFVTADHVIGGCATNAVLTPSGVIPADLVARSKDKDVAVIKARRVPAVYGLFSADPIRAFRRPLTVTRFLINGGLASGNTTTARFLGKTTAAGGRFAIRTKGKIAGGNSGAPVFDAQGAIVGMLVARAEKDRHVGVAVDVFSIAEFLSQSGVRVETSAGGGANPLAGGATVTRTFTFPVLCLRTEKKALNLD